jgi:hypothetical protein
MATYLVSYDLVGPNRDYEAVKDHIVRRTERERNRWKVSGWSRHQSPQVASVTG